MKNIFVTGATGFIGRELSFRLADSGHFVRALYRTKSKAAYLQHKNIVLIKGDLMDVPALEESMNGCAEIYHLAANTSLWAPNPALFEILNVDATKTILKVARKLKIKRMVITSSAGVIGPSFGTAVNEKTKRQIHFFNEYERTKWRSEQYISSFDSGETKIVMVNPTRVFGPGLLGTSNSTTRMMDLYLQGKFPIMPGSGQRIANYAFIDDVVDGHLLAMEKGSHKARYLLGGANVSYKEFFQNLTEISGKNYRQISISPKAISLIGRFMLWRAKHFDIAPVITPDWAFRLTDYDWEVSSQKAATELGYQITPFKEALQKTVQWINEKKGTTSSSSLF